ncbi:hypothetical protein NQZ68_034965 [Dissostichus eleginoides]|nr:hypothetical protein NQZ68_034965 [Dissostichus eleginoides]
MAFSLRNDPRRPDSPDSESAALSTCSNADIFRRMNTLLGNALDFSGVCTTPNNTRGKPDLLVAESGLQLDAIQAWREELAVQIAPSSSSDQSADFCHSKALHAHSAPRLALPPPASVRSLRKRG